MTTDSREKLVEVGVVGRPHGVDGKIHIFLHNPESTAFDKTHQLYIDFGKGLETRLLSEIRKGPHGLLARLEGCLNRTQAEQAKGAKIFIAREDLPAVAPDEFYVVDIIGIEAWDDGALLGHVSSSRPQGGIEVVTVESDAYTMEIPLVDNFVEKIDLSIGQIRFRETATLPRAVRKKKP